MALSPDGSRLFVTNDTDGYVRFINTATNRLSPPVTVGSNPSKLLMSADGSRLYVTNTDDDSVSVIDISAWPTAPAAPTTLNATPGNGSASIAFTPGADGGAAITKYQYKVGTGAWTDAVGTSSPITITGLTNYVAYSIRLRAVNGAGPGAASAAVSVKPRQAGPTVTAATPSGRTGIVVTFNLNPLPGTTVAYQSVVAYARGTNTVAGSCRTYAKRTTCYVGGLTPATNYDLRVTAHLPVPGKTWHNTTFEGSILQVRTNR
jgi:YVTN family beta-propeller protein